jgi:hypothetical protein
MNVYDWIQDVKQFGWSPAAYKEFRLLLQSQVKFSRPTRWPGLDGDGEESHREPRIKDFVDWEVVLRSGQDVRYHLEQIRAIAGWKDLLVSLLPDFTSLLKDALDLMSELEGASEQYDFSYISHPSISDHPQNQNFKDWSLLIDMCRDAWVETAQRDVRAAASEFNRWREIKYPVFRRLCLFGARTSESAVSSGEALELLSQDRSWWLWSVETQREAIRLICALARRLDDNDADRLTGLILRGPPRDMFKAELEESQWRQIKDRTIWLRLAKFESCGGHLSDEARTALVDNSAAHPEFALEADERDEFPSYISTGGPRGWKQHVTLPDTRPELACALRGRPSDDFLYEDNWRELLEKKFRVAIAALLQLAREQTWPQSAWQEALQYLSGEKIVRRAWYRLHKPLENAPAETIRSLASALTWWLQSAANALPPQAEPGFLQLVDKVLGARGSVAAESVALTLSQAINHPVGHLTEALLRWWYRTGPRVGGLLPALIRDRFTLLVTAEPTTGAARVALAAHVANLFIVDPMWTAEHLLPFFAWDMDPATAHHMWEAYLGNPNISIELLGGFKTQFLKTAEHYSELGAYGKQYAGLLAITLLELREGLSLAEARAALQSLGGDGIAEAAHRIAVGLANAREQCEEYWINRVKPLLEQAWPKSASFRSSEESCALAEVCIHAGGQFEDALNYLWPWLRPAPGCRLIALHLARTRMPNDWPALALKLLAAIVDTNQYSSPSGLREVLETIEGADRTLIDSQNFRRLRNHVEQFGLD